MDGVGFGRSKEKKILWRCVVFAILWVIWIKRNDRVFKERRLAESILWDRVVFSASLWSKVAGAFHDATSLTYLDPDSEVVVFAKRTVKDLKLPLGFVTQIAQSIQSQLTEFRSYEGQDMYVGEKIVPIKLDLRVNNTLIRDQFLWDLNNMESDPEEFARTFCADMDIEDPEVSPAIAFAIREQLYEIAVQNVTSAKEIKVNKKGRRGIEYIPVSKAGVTPVDLVKLFGSKSSVIRKRKEWDVYEPIVDILSNEEVEALEAREDRIAR